ncbi:protein kinase domain protein, partial [Ichthyophthirius multifiliis]
MKQKQIEYKKIKLLGEGSFGKAFLVQRTIDNQNCVIKQINISHMTDQEKQNAYKEARILSQLSHQNIITYHESYKTKNGSLCIVMDYAECGDISQKIKEVKNNKQNISENQILDYITQICCGLNYIHQKNIIHRDIKAQNIFLTKNQMIKIADFGISKVLSNSDEKAKTIIGSPYYLAPELIENRPYTTKVDIWGLGILIYELCALKPPFESENMHALVMKIIRGNYNPIPNQYSQELKKLLAEILNVDPLKRPTAQQILEKDNIKNIDQFSNFDQNQINKEQNNINQCKNKEQIKNKNINDNDNTNNNNNKNNNNNNNNNNQQQQQYQQYQYQQFTLKKSW